MALLARAQLETHSETPNMDLLPVDHPEYMLVRTIWPVTCFLIIASIVVHGSSIAVFALGKRINNMAITLTYTTGGNEPSWMSRLPRRNTENGGLLQLRRMETEEPLSNRVVHRKVLKKGKKKNKKPQTNQENNQDQPEAPIVEENTNNDYIILTLDAEFENAGSLYPEALSFLKEKDEIHTVHYAIVLAANNLLNHESAEKCKFNELIGKYTSHFRRVLPSLAVDYLTLINLPSTSNESQVAEQQQNCHEAIQELILETRRFSELIGDITTYTEHVVPGSIEKRMPLIGINDKHTYLNKIAHGAATKADNDGKIIDAILLYR
ncbi:hypothetical protein FF38_08698, partial [Lucilia cuprina]